MKERVDTEKLTFMKYYEHDGALRAYANRAMVLSFVFGAIALACLGFAIWVRMQPPTVIRVGADGEATVAGEFRQPASGGFLVHTSAVPGTSPTDIEGRAVIRKFLETYQTYTPTTVDKQFADALNLTTWNFRQRMLAEFRDQDVVGKIKEETVSSTFKVRSIEPVRDQPWAYVVIGVKELHRLRNQQEVIDRIVGRYTMRLVEQPRSEKVPNGLLVAESREQQVIGEKISGLDQESSLLNLVTSGTTAGERSKPK